MLRTVIKNHFNYCMHKLRTGNIWSCWGNCSIPLGPNFGCIPPRTKKNNVASKCSWDEKEKKDIPRIIPSSLLCYHRDIQPRPSVPTDTPQGYRWERRPTHSDTDQHSWGNRSKLHGLPYCMQITKDNLHVIIYIKTSQSKGLWSNIRIPMGSHVTRITFRRPYSNFPDYNITTK
jgi:hypothetical protein